MRYIRARINLIPMQSHTFANAALVLGSCGGGETLQKRLCTDIVISEIILYKINSNLRKILDVNTEKHAIPN